MLGISLEESRVYQDAKAEGEHNNKVKMIPKLLARGLSIDEIAEIVELSVEEVRQSIPPNA